jgi:hypothetical protein
MTTDVPAHLAAMIRREPPVDAVVSGSTPVVSFGDLGTARIATLGLNPSRVEFLDREGRELTGRDRRLATLRSLEAEQLDRLDDDQVAQVVRDCFSYFSRQPYTQWFDRLDRVLQHGAGASYYDGSACHLDLVPWATDPTWGGLSKSTQRQLLAHEADHLATLLRHADLKLVVVNGRSVIDALERTGLARFEPLRKLTLANGNYELLCGEGSDVTWRAWSLNAQSSPGVSNQELDQLGEWLAASMSPER